MRLLALTDEPPQNGYNEIEEVMDQSLDNRARILAALHAKGLPVDVSSTFHSPQFSIAENPSLTQLHRSAMTSMNTKSSLMSIMTRTLVSTIA